MRQLSMDLLLEDETNYEGGVSKCMQKIMINIIKCVASVIS